LYVIEVEGGDSSGKSETDETPQERKRRGGSALARGKRPPVTKINKIVLND